MNPVRASLRYPQVTLVIAGMLFIVGIYALVTMPRREDPKITIRTGTVSAVYPGATTEEVEDQVTRKIEERLFRFEEVRRERTFSTTRNGSVVINVELNESVKNADQFWSKLRLDLAQLKASDLPEQVRGPVVDSDFGDTVAMLVAVHGGSYGPRELKDYAQRVEDTLRTLPAVSKIKRIGDQKEEIDVSSSSERLAQYGINPQKVVRAFAGRNTVAYAGRVPAGQNKVALETDGAYKTEDDIRHTMVDVSPSGQPVYVSDVADVTRVYKDPDEYVRFNGEPAILLSIEVHDGYNIVEAGKDLHKALNAMSATLPPGVKLDMVADQPHMVSTRIFSFFREFGIAIVAVILVTMLLLPLRVALVSAVAIPMTVSATFALLNALGIELQQVSISALIVVLGMVVDDAIVITDNYVTLLDHGMPRKEAAWKCATQMAVPVLTATLTIIGAFLPILFLVTGAMGEFIGSLPIAVSVALATSFVVAMLLTPLVAHFFIREGLTASAAKTMKGVSKPTLLERMQRDYNKSITWAMRHKRQVLAGGALIFVVGISALELVPQLLFPLAERNQFVMDVWLPEGARIEATDAAVRRIEAVLRREPTVTSYSSFLGASAPRFYYNVNPQIPASNYAQILVNTKQAKGTPQLVTALRAKLGIVAPEARVFIKELQQGQVMEAPVEVRISGPDPAGLRSLGSQVEDVLRHTRGATYIHTDWHEDVWQMGVNIRQEEANRLGLTNAVIAQQLAGDFEGAPLTDYWEGDRDVDVVLRLDPGRRQDFTNVADTYIMSPATGVRVPVGAVATLTPEWHPGRIVRRNGVRTLSVRAFPDGNRLASEVLGDVRKQVNRIQLPQGYHIEYGGEEKNKQESFPELSSALAASLALIFLILLLQFRTLVDPLIVMMAFPLALPGAAIGLLITRNTFGFTAFVGIVSLGGLAMRNSIILIDYIYERLHAGANLEQAALEAGERRLRPIFLTTMAAAIGVLPMILSGSSLWSPLATAIAFGLLGSMFFTLIVIPVLFVVAHRWGASKMKAAGPAAAMLALAMFALPGQAQQRTVTLDEAVTLAMKNNAAVRLAELKVKEAEAKMVQARANYFPVATNQTNQINVNATEALTIPQGLLGTYNATGPLPGNDVKIPLGKQNFFIATTTVAQPVTQMFKIHAGVSAAEAEARMARDTLGQTQNEVSLNVKKLYYRLLAAQERKHAAELRIEAGEARLKEAQDATESGVALRVKVLQAQAQTAEARHTLGSVEDQIADMTNSFNDLVGLPLPTQTVLAEPTAPSDAGAARPTNLPDDPEDEALNNNPDFLFAQSALVKAHAGLNAARAEYIPDVSLFVQHVYQNGVPLLPENSAAIGVRVNWTISEFGQRIGLVRERATQVEQAEENLRSTENRVCMEVQSEERKVRRSETGLEAAREDVAARTELARITGDEVTAKTATASELKDAQAQLAEAKAQFFDAEVQQAIAQAELLRTEGRR